MALTVAMCSWMLMSCSGEQDMPDVRVNTATLHLSVDVGDLPQPTRALTGDGTFEDPASKYERVHTLRVVIVRANGVIEHNRMVTVRPDFSGSTITSNNIIGDNLKFKVIAGESKTIYLFANERAVDFNFQDKLPVGAAFPTAEVEGILLTRRPDAAFIDNGLGVTEKDMRYIPMSESFFVQIPEATGNVEDELKEHLFLTRSLIKFSFCFITQTGFSMEGITVDAIKIEGLANTGYYMPHVADNQYSPGKYMDAPDNGERTITAFEVPAETGASAYTFPVNVPITAGMDTSGGTGYPALTPAVYFPESKTNSSYLVSLTFRNEWQNGVLESQPLLIKDIARNTHVKINIEIEDRRINATVTLLPYTGVSLNPSFGF